MTTPGAHFLRRVAGIVARDGTVTLVTVADTKGSAPREIGAMMAVLVDGSYLGTIGGGALEHEAQVLARQLAVQAQSASRRIDRALGPDLGQCCGGRVLLDLRVLTREDLAELNERAKAADLCDTRQPLLLFGAGHVGRALSLALAPLPFRITWVDGRDDAFPAVIPANAEALASRNPPAEVARAESGSFVLVLTHDHALDLAITAAALARDDLPFVGLIGSATKRARFERRLHELGLSDVRIAALACPIGLPGIHGKEPPVIAASVAAQLLSLVDERTRVSAKDRTRILSPSKDGGSSIPSA